MSYHAVRAALHAQVQFAVSGRHWDRSFDTSGPTTPEQASTEGLDVAAVIRAVEALYH